MQPMPPPVIHPDLTEELQRLSAADPAFAESGFDCTADDDDDRWSPIKKAFSPHQMAEAVANFEAIYELASENNPPISKRERDFFRSLEELRYESLNSLPKLLEPVNLQTACSHAYRSGPSWNGAAWVACEEMASRNQDSAPTKSQIKVLYTEFWENFFASQSPPMNSAHAHDMIAMNGFILAMMRRCAVYIAKLALESLTAPPFCLHEKFLLHTFPGSKITLPPEVSCWLFFGEDPVFDHAEFDGIRMLQYYGVWAYDTPAGMRIAGLAKGYYFFCGYDDLDRNDLLYIADSHSLHLSNIAKHLVGDFVKGQDMEWEEYFANWERFSFATAHLYVAPEFRGQKLANDMLGTIVGMTETPRDIDPTRLLRYPPGERPSDIFKRSPIQLFVMEVEGTPPQELEIEVHKAMSTQKNTAPPLVDMSVEKRRKKLSAYFNEMSNEQFEVTTYNPWDYPVT